MCTCAPTAGIRKLQVTVYQFIDDHTVIHSGEEQEHRRGVALVLDKMLSRSLVSWQAISSRILTARMLHKHGHLTVVVAYAPTEDSTMNSKDEFYIT